MKATVGLWSGSRDVRMRMQQRHCTVLLTVRQPMILTGQRWHVVSPEDTWMLLNGKLTESDMIGFDGIVREVLTAPDPLQGLDFAAQNGVQVDAM